MKVFLLIASIFLNSLGECSPNTEEPRPLKKKVAFLDDPEVIVDTTPNPDGDLVFHMNLSEFERNFSRKAELYKKSRPEAHFLDSLASVIERNYLSYNQVYDFTDGLDRFDTELSKITAPAVGGGFISFPNPEILAKLLLQKESLNVKLHKSLNAMQPSYDMVEPLLKMMNSMDADTKIDAKIFRQMYRESLKVIEVCKKVKKVFKNFPLLEYRNLLNKTRKNTNRLQSGKRDYLEAVKELTELVPQIDKLHEKLDKTADKALKINYTILFDATTNVYGFVVTLLNFDEASFLSRDTQLLNVDEASSSKEEISLLNVDEVSSLNEETSSLNVDEASSSSRDKKGKASKKVRNFFGKLSIRK